MTKIGSVAAINLPHVSVGFNKAPTCQPQIATAPCPINARRWRVDSDRDGHSRGHKYQCEHFRLFLIPTISLHSYHQSLLSHQQKKTHPLSIYPHKTARIKINLPSLLPSQSFNSPKEPPKPSHAFLPHNPRRPPRRPPSHSRHPQEPTKMPCPPRRRTRPSRLHPGRFE